MLDIQPQETKQNKIKSRVLDRREIHKEEEKTKKSVGGHGRKRNRERDGINPSEAEADVISMVIDRWYYERLLILDA
jgi:hypothetical protein